METWEREELRKIYQKEENTDDSFMNSGTLNPKTDTEPAEGWFSATRKLCCCTISRIPNHGKAQSR